MKWKAPPRHTRFCLESRLAGQSEDRIGGKVISHLVGVWKETDVTLIEKLSTRYEFQRDVQLELLQTDVWRFRLLLLPVLPLLRTTRAKRSLIAFRVTIFHDSLNSAIKSNQHRTTLLYWPFRFSILKPTEAFFSSAAFLKPQIAPFAPLLTGLWCFSEAEKRKKLKNKKKTCSRSPGEGRKEGSPIVANQFFAYFLVLFLK